MRHGLASLHFELDLGPVFGLEERTDLVSDYSFWLWHLHHFDGLFEETTSIRFHHPFWRRFRGGEGEEVANRTLSPRNLCHGSQREQRPLSPCSLFILQVCVYRTLSKWLSFKASIMMFEPIAVPRPCPAFSHFCQREQGQVRPITWNRQSYRLRTWHTVHLVALEKNNRPTMPARSVSASFASEPDRR